MWDTGVGAGEATVAEGLGVDPPPPLTRGGWVGGRVVATRRGDTGDKTVSGDKTAPGDKMYTQHTRDTGLAAPDWRGERNTRGAHEHVGDTKRSTLSTLLITRLLSSD